MLIRFSAKNFRSFGQQHVSLDMVSSSKIQKHSDHICKTKLPIKVLRNAVVYGANAAGKSNLIKALQFFVSTVQSGALPNGINKEFCRTDEANAALESAFDIQVEMEGQCFDYGFSCLMAEGTITSEWLYRLKNGSDAKRLFERSLDKGIELFVKEGKDAIRFGIYRDDFIASTGLSSDKLFLSALNKGKSFDEKSPLGFFALVYRWFKEKVRIFGAGMPGPDWNFYIDSRLDEVGSLFASFDTGVTKLEKVTVPIEDLSEHTALVMELKRVLENSPMPKKGSSTGMIVRVNDLFVGINKDDKGEIDTTTMKIKHGSSPFAYDYGDESDGTKRLFDFVDMFLNKDRDVLYVVDELSLSLHPLLTQHIIELFNAVHKDDSCQLVFTTHENDIMSFDYFRRDEIWFVERNAQGESTLYPLDEFAEIVRSDTRTDKSYMAGRYGGIPVLSLDNSLAAIEG